MNFSRMPAATSSLSTIEFVTLVVFSCFIIPFVYYPGIVDPALSIRLILLAVLVVALAVSHLIRSIQVPHEQRVGSPRLLSVLCLGYLAACLLSDFRSINTAEAILETVRVFLFCGYVLLLSSILGRSLNRIAIVAKAIVISSLCISLLGILEIWGVFRLVDNGWAGPGVTMVNRNLLSSYLLLCLGFVAMAIVLCKGTWRFLGTLACAMAVYVLLSTQTRAAWAGCLCGAFFAIVTVLVIRPRSLRVLLREERRLVLTVAVLILIAVALAAGLRPGGGWETPSLAKRAASMADPAFASNRERILLWRKTCEMIREHPLAGVGAGNWKIEVPRYGTGDLICTDMTVAEVRPYNDFLWVGSEMGFFGIAFYGGLFLACGLYCIRALRAGRSRTQIVSSVAMLFAVAGFAVVSFFDFPKERIEHLVLFGTVISTGAAAGMQESRWIGVAGWRFRCLIVFVLLAACGCLVIVRSRLTGDINDAAMRSLWENKKWKEVIVAADRASSIFYSVEPSATPLAWYRGVANFKLGNVQEAFLDFSRAHACHPWNLNVLNDLGTCCSLRGEGNLANEYFSAALAVSPFFEPALINLAASYYNAGQYDRAYGTIMRCKSPHADPRFEPYLKAISEKFKKGGCP